MADFGIVAEPRTIVGKKVKQLRREGLVPGVMYGKEEPVHLQLNDRELRDIFRKGAKDAQIDLTISGQKKMVIVKDLQRHVLRGDLIHIDFLEVSATDLLITEATLILIGDAPVLRVETGMISQLTQSVEIETTAANMVGEIEVDLAAIAEATDTILVQDLVLPEGVTMLTDSDTMIARFTEATVREEEEVTEGEEGEEGEGEAAEGAAEESAE